MNWAGVVKPKEAVAPPAAASFELFELVGNKWRPIHDVPVKSLLEGPYVVRIGDLYFSGSETANDKLQGKKLDWSFKLIDRFCQPCIEAGLTPEFLLGMTFKGLVANYLATAVFGGKFITKQLKTVNGCQQTQTSIRF